MKKAPILIAVVLAAFLLSTCGSAALPTDGQGISTVEQPTFSPVAGTYTSAQSVTISTTTVGASIRYTTDGSTPTSTYGTMCSGSISVAASETIKAIAFQTGLHDSTIAVAAFAIIPWQSLGGPTSGSGTDQFFAPCGIAVDTNGHIFVADTGNDRIVRMDSIDGGGWTVFGSFGSGPGQFKSPSGIAVDAGGHIYVADTGNNRIVRMNDMGGTGPSLGGTSPGSGTNQFNSPNSIALDNTERIFVADSDNSRIVRMDDISGSGWTTFGSLGTGSNAFYSPTGIAVDAYGQYLFVADWGNSRVARMGAGWIAFGSYGAAKNQFYHPFGIALDRSSGRVFVADMENNRIVRLDDMDGSGWSSLGGGGASGRDSGSGIYQFSRPTGIALDGNGYLYVADEDNNRIIRLLMP